jgi:hypothetical protein
MAFLVMWPTVNHAVADRTGQWSLSRRGAASDTGVVSITSFAYDTLYRPRRDSVEFVDVPELAFLSADGQGAPEGPEFSAAVQALYSVSYAAHFLVKKAFGEAPRVMPLEGLWWVAESQDAGPASAGPGDWLHTPRDEWHWSAMIMQPDPVDEAVVAEAMAQARAKDLAALDRVALRRWTEGLSAQVLHVGPYAAEAASIQRLHRAIEESGHRPRGRHHEIYLGDPRRSAPEHLRTILRQPVEPARPSVQPERIPVEPA